MINIGNNSIENILVGDTLVDRVYLGTDIVWEHLQHDEHDYVEIGGVQWATTNVGANNVTDTGLYFLWGDTQGYSASQVGTDKLFSWSDYKYTNDGGSTMTKYNSTDNKTVLDLSDDPANFNWGSDWRLPTKQEYAALLSATNCYYGNNNGVYGLFFIDKTDESKELFFPTSGYALDGIVGNINVSGAYWSGSLDDVEIQKGDILYFYSGYRNFCYAANRRTGYNIRAVHVRDYLKFTALESGTFTLTIPDSVDATCLESVSYSLDNGATWVTTQNTSSAVTITTPTVAEGGTVLWKGSGTQMAVGANANKYSNFSSTGSFQASGNIMSLLYQDTFENELTLSRLFAFAHLFYQCPNITTPPELPATTINSHAYRGMFTDCTSLTIAPELPAMTAKYSCYDYMFAGCSSLITAPELPATTLENYCYEKMFDGCSNLKYPPSVIPANSISNYGCYAMFANCNKLLSAPDIYATLFDSHSCELMFNYCSSLIVAPNIHPTVVSERCCNNMFWGCTSLKTAPSILPATTLANGCYRYMFDECKNLENAPELPALTLVSDCYLGMFHNCNKINRIKAMFTTTPSNSYTQNWVQYIASSGTFVKNVEATWDVRGNNGIPTNWTVETAPRDYLKFTALESGTFTLTIPSGVTSSHLTSISYSLDNGATWTTTANDSTDITITTPTVAQGGTVLWKGTGTQMAISTSVYSNFSSTGSFQASGNIMSLFYQDTFENELELTKTYCFCRLFYNCSTIVSMPQLSATTLTQNCYREMFYGCTSLTETTELYSINTYNSSYESMFKGCTSLVIAPKIKARTFYSSSCREMFSGCTSLTTMPEFVPETMAQGNTYQLFAMFKGCTSLVNAPSLPATTVTSSCYREMFYGCKSLTNISSLPATTLDTACYQSMFERCTSLVNTPTLPAITLASSCYRGMFYGCTSLKNVTELPALTLTVQCYYDMFNGCSSLTYIKCLATDISASNCIVNWVRSVPANVGTFVKNPEMLSWSSGVSGIPSGWTVEDADD